MDHGSIPMQQRHANGGEGRSGGGGGGAGGGGGVAGNVLSTSACRASGARWTPTSEQIRILRELYYGCGIRSPNAEQIQRIAARLRQYGRIEGKNVFYWFQNHKARERQKKRLTTLDVNTSSSSAAAADVNHLGGVLSLSPSGAVAVASSAGFYAGNGGGSAVQLEASTNCWDSSTTMATERSLMQLQDYMGVRSVGDHHGGAGAVGAAPWACFPFAADQTPMTMTTATREPETLPLFPTGGGRHGGPGDSGGHGHQESVVHGGYLQSNFPCWGAGATTTTITVQQHHQLLQQLQEQHSFYSSSNQLPSSQDAAGTSLELSLSSYCSPYPAGSM